LAHEIFFTFSIDKIYIFPPASRLLSPKSLYPFPNFGCNEKLLRNTGSTYLKAVLTNMTGVVDRVACWPVRLESAAVRAAKTPARHKRLLAFFHTPQLETELPIEVSDI